MERQSAEEIEDEAADWLARLDRHGRTPELVAAFEAWLADDSRRNGAVLQAQAAWNLLNDQLAPMPEVFDPEWAEGSDPAPDVPQRWMQRRKFLLGGGAIAASVAAAGWFGLRGGGEVYETRTGEIRRVPLADGSLVAINTHSAVRVELQRDARIVRLASGEAWFQVAKDKMRPFTVEADRVRVRAVGTAFSVRRRANGADVIVTEGTVEAWVAGAEGDLVRLSAGQRAFVADDAPIVQKTETAAEADRTLAWRAGQIDLAGESITDAIAEFNRYNERKIVLADPRLAAEPLFGVFQTDDPESFAQAVHVGFGVPVTVAKDRIDIGASSN